MRKLKLNLNNNQNRTFDMWLNMDINLNHFIDSIDY